MGNKDYISARVNQRLYELVSRSSEYYYCSNAQIVKTLVNFAMMNNRIDTFRTLQTPLEDRGNLVKFRCDIKYKYKWHDLLRSLNIDNSDFAIRCLIESANKTSNSKNELIIQLDPRLASVFVSPAS